MEEPFRKVLYNFRLIAGTRNIIKKSADTLLGATKDNRDRGLRNSQKLIYPRIFFTNQSSKFRVTVLIYIKMILRNLNT